MYMYEGKKCELPIARIQCDTPFLFVHPNPEALVTPVKEVIIQ